MANLPFELLAYLISTLDISLNDSKESLIALKNVRLVCSDFARYAKRPMFAAAKPLELNVSSPPTLAKAMNSNVLDCAVKLSVSTCSYLPARQGGERC